MKVEGTKDFQRVVRAVEDQGFLTALIKLDICTVENHAKWTVKERDDFLQRAEDACREACGWLKTQISPAEGE